MKGYFDQKQKMFFLLSLSVEVKLMGLTDEPQLSLWNFLIPAQTCSSLMDGIMSLFANTTQLGVTL